ncbi:FecR family protein [Novosphingobium mangrovi (ex Huang et al. 2023)]|uniref:FecR domain-containing protein n=1 Tax=Novosphingobium mangrovi (ex Huang et al. 2023) TaxID=2976432 RepID=A0ABT2I815_9SPHN|nr:FecR domain-containing protein [Novosphingobium mangrovi (ex Huang et al. 2023)]MCT2400941.1 FecR domain-containing protein [Novosphingobium mangrovi (ex Huang et al. 2023)]
MTEAIEAKAASLAVRLPDAGETERAEIMAWVAQNPAHAVAFARAESAWKDCERLKALGFDLPEEDDGIDEVSVPVETGKGLSRRGVILSGIAALAIAAAVPAVRMLGPETQDFSTQRGEVREVRLADGSTLRINTDSKVEVAFSDKRRLVRLLEGEASFDVAHDKARPFDVEADGTVTRAVGTQFTVRRRAHEVELTVTEGIVSVRDGTGQEARIAAGHGAQIKPGAIDASVLDSRTIARRTAWRERMLEFDGLTIGEAVAEFNRYRQTPIVIADPRIASLRVGGRFGLSESEQFLDALQSGFGVRVSKRADGAMEIAEPH